MYFFLKKRIGSWTQVPNRVLRSICSWEIISCDCCKVFSQDPPAHSLFWLECLPSYGLCALYYILLCVNNSFFNISTIGVPDVNSLATFILVYLQCHFVFGLNAGCEGVSDIPAAESFLLCALTPSAPQGQHGRQQLQVLQSLGRPEGGFLLGF